MATKKKATKTTTKKKTPTVTSTAGKTASKTAGKSTRKTATSKATTRKRAPAGKTSPTPEDHYKMIRDAAYFQAEADGFREDPLRYWVDAEKTVAARLAGGK